MKKVDTPSSTCDTQITGSGESLIKARDKQVTSAIQFKCLLYSSGEFNKELVENVNIYGGREVVLPSLEPRSQPSLIRQRLTMPPVPLMYAEFFQRSFSKYVLLWIVNHLYFKIYQLIRYYVDFIDRRLRIQSESYTINLLHKFVYFLLSNE